MADSDPKRLGSARRASDRPAFDANDDPLVELARIVSDDGSFYSGSRKVTELRPAARRQDERGGFSADLEAELMQELEASLRPQPLAPEVSAPPRPEEPRGQPGAAAPRVEAVRPRAEPPLHQPVAAETRRPAAFRPAPAAEPQPRQPERSARIEPVLPITPPRPAEPVAEVRASEHPAHSWEPSHGRPVARFAEDPGAAVYDANVAAEDEVELAPDFDSPEFDLEDIDREEPRGEVQGEPGYVAQDDPVDDIWAPGFGTGPAEAPERTPFPEDDVLSALEAELAEPEESAQTGIAGIEKPLELPEIGDFTEEDRTAWGGRRRLREDLPHAPRPAADEDADADANSDEEWVARASDPEQELPTTFGHFDEPPRRSEPAHRDSLIAAVPVAAAAAAMPAGAEGYAGGADNEFDDQFEIPAPPPSGRTSKPARPVAARPARGAGGSRRGLMLVAGVVGVAALGAVAAIFIGGDGEVNSGPPPLISAESGAVKINAEPTETADSGEAPGAAVYDRVSGEAPETGGALVDNSEEPREVARIVLPPSSDSTTIPESGGNGTATKNEERLTNSGSTSDAIDPRRVRTFVVRPDGTIVPSTEAAEASDASAPAAATPETLVPSGEPLEPNRVRTTSISDPLTQDVAVAAPGADAAPGDPAASTADLAALQDSAEAGSGPRLPLPRPLLSQGPGDAASGDTAGDITAAPEQAPVAAPAETAVARIEPTVTAPTPPQPAATPSPVPAGGGYLVQVSSQRSEDAAQASLADMQRRYPSILGGVSSDIQRADLGEKGIYYRARVGPLATRTEAIELCEALKAAGGSCFVTQ